MKAARLRLERKIPMADSIIPAIILGLHIFVGSKASWETIPEGVPQYEAGPPAAKPEDA